MDIHSSDIAILCDLGSKNLFSPNFFENLRKTIPFLQFRKKLFTYAYHSRSYGLRNDHSSVYLG